MCKRRFTDSGGEAASRPISLLAFIVYVSAFIYQALGEREAAPRPISLLAFIADVSAFLYQALGFPPSMCFSCLHNKGGNFLLKCGRRYSFRRGIMGVISSPLGGPEHHILHGVVWLQRDAKRNCLQHVYSAMYS